MVIADMDVVCAGLLEVEAVPVRSPTVKVREAGMESLQPYANMIVSFIHRSAYDYLRYPKEGQELRCSHTFEDSAIRYFEASLAICRFIRIKSYHPSEAHLDWLHHNQANLTQGCVRELVNAFHYAVLKGYIAEDSERPRAMDFSIYVALYGIRDLVKDYVERNAARDTALTVYLQAACSLSKIRYYRHSHYERGGRDCPGLQYTLETIQYLLDQGADPTARMLPAFGGYTIVNFSQAKYHVDLTPPFGVLLLYLINNSFEEDALDTQNLIEPLARIMQTLYQQGVDQNAKIPVVWQRRSGQYVNWHPLRVLSGSALELAIYLSPSEERLILVLEMPISLLCNWTLIRMLGLGLYCPDVSGVRVVSFSSLEDQEMPADEEASVTSGYRFKYYKVDSPKDLAEILEAVNIWSVGNANWTVVYQMQKRLPILEAPESYFMELGWCAPVEPNDRHEYLVSTTL